MTIVILVVMVALIIFLIAGTLQSIKDKQLKGGAKAGTLGVSVLMIIVILVVGLGLAGRYGSGGTINSTPESQKAEKIKKQKAKKKALEAKKKAEAKKRKEAKAEKQKAFEMKDSQKTMTEDLANNSDLKQFIESITYQGDGDALVKVTDDFLLLNDAERMVVAKAVNNLVTSDTEDVHETDIDPYSLLTFTTHNGEPVGHSKISDHNSYKWSK